MDIGYEKERFETFKLKSSVAKKFRSFSKKFSKSQSMTLLTMLNFFEVNEVSPNERLGETVSSLKHQMQKRFNAVIAIIRDIEKTQTKPTTAILQALLEGTSDSANEEEEELDFGTPTLITENEELVYYREEYYRNQEQLNSMNNDLEMILNNTKYIKGNFGGGYLKLEMSKEEFKKLKQRIDNVHNDNSTKDK